MNVPILEAPAVDLEALRGHRVSRLCAQMAAHHADAVVLTNPVSLRYAADWREYALFQAHIPTYYLVVTADARLIMFGAYRQEHPTIHDFRAAHHPNVFDSGLDTLTSATRFAADIEGVVGPRARIALDRVNPSCVQAPAKMSSWPSCTRSTSPMAATGSTGACCAADRGPILGTRRRAHADSKMGTCSRSTPT